MSVETAVALALVCLFAWPLLFVPGWVLAQLGAPDARETYPRGEEDV